MGTAVWGGAWEFWGVEVQEGCWRLVGGLGGVTGLESGLLIWVLCPLSLEGLWAVKAGGVDLVLWAVGGVGVPVGSGRALWGLVGGCC